LEGPIATRIRSDWSQIAASPAVLTHCDYWSGNVVWRDGMLTGIVDWSGGARGPRGFDVGWCRLDLYLLFDERAADVFQWTSRLLEQRDSGRRGSASGDAARGRRG